MRKILSGAMIVTLVVLFAATYFSSHKTEQVFKAQAEELNRTYGGLLQVELLDYQRGLLVSEVKTRLKLPQQQFSLQHTIRHFPWKVRVLTKLATESSSSAQPSPLAQLQLQTDISLDGDSQSLLNLAALKFSDGAVEVELQDLHFDCRLDGQFSNGQIAAQLSGMKIAESGVAQFALSGISLQSQFSDLQGLPLGGGEVRVEQIAWQSNRRPGFELNELVYKAESRLELERLSSAVELLLGELKLGGETFSDGRLLFQVEGLDAATIRQVQEDARQLQAELLDQQIDPLILQLQMMGLYSQLLEKGVTLSLPRLSLRTVDGDLQGDGSFRLQGLDLSRGSLDVFRQLTGRFQLDLDRQIFAAGFRAVSRVDQPKAKQNPAVLNELAEQLAGGLVQKGIFVRREGGYRLDFSIEDGQARLNEQRFPL